MIARAKKKIGEQTDEKRQYMNVVSKIDYEALIQSSNRHRVVENKHEVSFI